MTPHVVVVGAGFGGLTAARALARFGAHVTLVDQRNYHLFQPLLYQVATAGLQPGDIAYPLRGILHRDPRIEVRVDEVTAADFAERVVGLRGGGRLPYDHLVLAAGAVADDFGVPGVVEHGFQLKSLDDAVGLRSHLLRCFEEASADPARIDDGWLTAAIVGGGPTGVEMAGALAELVDKVLAKDFPRLDLRRARVVLLEMTDSVLPTYQPASRRHALDTLRSKGVEVLLGRVVKEVTAAGVRLDGGEDIPTRTLLWAAGVRATPLAQALRLQTQKAGRVSVAPDLSVPDVANVWAIGDIAAATDEDGELLPQLAPVAVQAGRHVAEQIMRRAHARPTRRFHYLDKGTMATIGRRAAVAELPFGLRLRGTLAWLAWLALHLVTLMGFRNRLSVLLNWAWNYLTWDRGARLILRPARDN